MVTYRVVINIGPSCDLCGLCVDVCPTGVFKIEGGKLVVNEELCIYCKGCVALCPRKAISMSMLDEGLKIMCRKSLI